MALKNSVKLGILGIVTAGAAYLVGTQDCDYETREYQRLRCEEQLSVLRKEFRNTCEAKTHSTFYDGSLDRIVDQRNQLSCADEIWMCRPNRQAYISESDFVATFEYK